MFLRRKAVLLLDTTYVKIISKLVCGYRIPDTLETYGAKSGYRIPDTLKTYGAKSGYRIPDTLKTYGANTEIRVYVLNPVWRVDALASKLLPVPQ